MELRAIMIDVEAVFRNLLSITHWKYVIYITWIIDFQYWQWVLEYGHNKYDAIACIPDVSTCEQEGKREIEAGLPIKKKIDNNSIDNIICVNVWKTLACVCGLKLLYDIKNVRIPTESYVRKKEDR